jgi:chloride channel protein, CIC family
MKEMEDPMAEGSSVKTPAAAAHPEGVAKSMTTQPPAEAVPFTQRREFWILMAYAVVLGVIGALFALVFMGFVNVSNNWFSSDNSHWMGGSWWWVGVTAASGLLVGLLRMATRLPEKTSGLIDEMKEEYVDPRLVVGTVLVSAASLAGGASLGPEKALGSVGGGSGRWLARRQGMDLEDRKVSTMAGFAAAFGGLFSAPILVILLIIDAARPSGRQLPKVFIASMVSSSISFGVYVVIAGTVFLDVYRVPRYAFKDRYLLDGIWLGLLAAVVVALLGIAMKTSGALFDRLKAPSLVKSTIGGVIFGVIGVALPLTMFTGVEQLSTVLKDGAALGVGLVVLLVVGKILTFAISAASGFVGGPIFPTIFIGGSTGVALHVAFPSLPLGLTFTCMLAAVPGGIIAAPLTLAVFAAFMTNVGALNSTPILIAVVTSFLATEAVKFVLSSRKPAPSTSVPASTPVPTS